MQAIKGKGFETQGPGRFDTSYGPFRCPAGRHVKDACPHPGSKKYLTLHTARRRAKNKVARRSRKVNR